MPVPLAIYALGSAGVSLAFRAAASPLGQKIIEQAYYGVSGIGSGLAGTYNRTAQALGFAGAMIVAGSAAASAKEESPAPDAANPAAVYKPQVPIAY